MTDIELLSFSQLNGWAGCGERYWLERVVKVPETPAWALIGGSTVHELTENYDKSRLGVDTSSPSFEEIFERRTVEAEEKSGLDRSQFRASGRKSAAYPEKENPKWWHENGPAMFDRWVVFTNNVPWDIWTTPAGDPAIEIPFELMLQSNTLKVRGFVDRVFVDPSTGGLICVDIKTGASKQSSNRQLGTYRVGLSDKYGVDIPYGTFWDARSGGTSEVASLNEWSKARVAWQYAKVRQARELGIYVANPGPMCSGCSVRDFCPEVDGSRMYEVQQPWISDEEWNAE